MPKPDDFPAGHSDESELLLSFLGYLRGAVIRNLDGVSDTGGRWTPDGHLLSLLGIVNHLTHVEWRWIDGAMLRREVSRSEDEFRPGPELTVASATAAYQARGAATDAYVRAVPSLAEPCHRHHDGQPGGKDLRWVLVHLINETARHAGHADATRELYDGAIGE